MSVICPKCFGTNVSCEAMINPNTKEFANYTDDSFDYGWCDDCKGVVELIDTNKTANQIKKETERFVSTHGKDPLYAVCAIIDKNEDDVCVRKFKLSCDSEDYCDTDYYCNGPESLVSFAEPGVEDFIIVELLYFIN